MTGTTPQESTTPPPPPLSESDDHEQQPRNKEDAVASAPSSSSDEDKKKWGTHIMGPPAVPTAHPDNQKAASWNADDQQQMSQQQHPYVQFSPVEKPLNNPFEPVINVFNSWSRKTETIATNIWHNLKVGPSVSGAAWGKVNLSVRAMTTGGFESLYKQTFATDPNEKLLKTFACYLSTTTGPVAGTLYLSTLRLSFCSDRPLTFIAPSGQEAWSYYKVMVPLGSIGTVNPVIMKPNPPEKYIQIVTIDGHDFWFMGFVNFEKATNHLLNRVSDFRGAEYGAQPSIP